jgi:hypothetical protein
MAFRFVFLLVISTAKQYLARINLSEKRFPVRSLRIGTMGARRKGQVDKQMPPFANRIQNAVSRAPAIRTIARDSSACVSQSRTRSVS